jgi:hypothetical protein
MNRKATGRRSSARPAARSKSGSNAARRVAADTPSLRELWLAGLGAAAATGEAATGLAELLVEKGREAEPRVRASAGKVASALSREGRRVADDLGTRAKGAVEGAFERLGVTPRKRTKNVLHRLGDLAEAIL